MLLNQIKENSEDRAYRLITESLIKFYKPGDYLFERALTHELGMSRTPIAIALNRLISEGLLKKQPKKGCYIPKISFADAQDVFAMRRVLEVAAVHFVIAQQDAGMLARLQVNIDESTLAVRHDDFETFYLLNVEFHNELIASSHNEYLYRAWKRIFVRCNMYTEYFSNSLKQNQFLKENLLNDHCEILEAINSCDVDRAIMCINLYFDHIVTYTVESTLLYENV